MVRGRPAAQRLARGLALALSEAAR